MTAIVNQFGGTSVIATTTENSFVVSVVGAQGPKGDQGDAGTGASGISYHAFAYGDSSPSTLETVASGKAVVNAKILIEEAFDGTGATLKLGDVSDAESVMAAADNDPATVGTYETAPGVSWGSSTALRLTITPGSGASTGSGVVVLQIES